jgi:hypothetical protein
MQVKEKKKKIHESRYIGHNMLCEEYDASNISTCFFRFGLIALRCVIHKVGGNIQTVGKNDVTNIVASNAQAIQIHGISALECHFNSLQVCIHADIHT